MSTRATYAVRSLVAAAALLAGGAALASGSDALSAWNRPVTPLDYSDGRELVAAPDYRVDPDRRPKPQDWVAPPKWKL